MSRFAANLTMLFREWPFLDRFDAAADAGFRLVECQFPYAAPADAVAARLARNRLDLVMFNAPVGDFEAGERGYAALPDGFAAMQASVRAAVDYARTTGTPRIHLLSGKADPSDPGAVAAYRRALGWAAAEMDRHGIGLLIEPLNRHDNPGYFLNDFRIAERAIAALGSPGPRLQFDIYHRHIMHGDVLPALERLMPLIGHIQIASLPDRHEPGTGELDDRAIVRTLDRLGYAGAIGCEYLPRAGTVDGLGWMQALA